MRVGPIDAAKVASAKKAVEYEPLINAQTDEIASPDQISQTVCHTRSVSAWLFESLLGIL